MSKRTGNRSGKRGRGKHNKQYSHERGTVLAKKMRAKEIEEARKALVAPPPDPTEGFF